MPAGNDELVRARALLEADPVAALREAQALIRKAPDARALRLAASAHRQLGQPAEAALAELAGINVSLEDPRLKEAATALRQGRRADAARIAGGVLKEEPVDLLALTIASEAAIAERRFDDADEKLGLVLERAPGFLGASVLQATSLKARARMREAIAVLENILKRDRSNGAALALLGECYAEIGEIEATVDTYRKLTGVDPSQPRIWIMLAQYLRILGRTDESKAAFRKALTLDPAQGAAWWGLAHFFPRDISDEDMETMERAIAERSGTAADEAPTRIALGLLAERRGDHEAAFTNLSRGKALRLENQPYDPDRLTADVDSAIRYFTSELYRSKSGSDDDSPIFVVGMPRSGSTLVERILGQHSDIEAAGELQVLPKLVDSLRYENGEPRSYAEVVAGLPSKALKELGSAYVERSLDYRHSAKPKFVDKFNLNWLHAPFIRLVLPKARILDVRRNALDCCWSNFKMLFADGHANDLRHIGQLYRDYVRLVDHVDSVAPGGILRVRYEDLVDNVENETRGMLDFIGVPFERQCVDFHLSEAPVATPSSEQVRQPINRSAVGSAEPYRQWLGPLIEELGPLADS